MDAPLVPRASEPDPEDTVAPEPVSSDVEHPSGGAEGSTPPTPSPPRPGGTVLIPVGMARRADVEEPPPPPEGDSAAPEVDTGDAAAAADGPSESAAAANADAADAADGPSESADDADDADAADDGPPSMPEASSVPPSWSSLPSSGSVPSAVIEAVRRQHEIEQRRSRRRLFLVLGGLSAGVLALVVTLVALLTTQGNARADREKRFLDAHRVVLETASGADAELVAAMKKATEDPKTDLAAWGSAADESERKLASLALPSSGGRFAAAATRVRRVVEAHVEVFRTVEELAARPPAERDAVAVQRLAERWEAAAKALAAAYADNPDVAQPPWSMWTSTVEDFAEAVVASGERARANAAALAEIERYRSQVQPILDRYEQLRTQLGDYEARKKRVPDHAAYARITGFFEGAASAREELASSLDAVTPPEGFAALHAGLVSLINRMAGEVRSAQQAVAEAYCYGSAGDCPTIGDTVRYKQYVLTTNALADEFARTKSAWTNQISQETQRLQ